MLNQKIRRLTEIECERLQGFEDNWTEKGYVYHTKEYLKKCAEKGQVTIEYVEEKISSTQRYKCLGNAVSVPIVKMIIERLKI